MFGIYETLVLSIIASTYSVDCLWHSNVVLADIYLGASKTQRSWALDILLLGLIKLLCPTNAGLTSTYTQRTSTSSPYSQSGTLLDSVLLVFLAPKTQYKSASFIDMKPLTSRS